MDLGRASPAASTQSIKVSEKTKPRRGPRLTAEDVDWHALRHDAAAAETFLATADRWAGERGGVGEEHHVTRSPSHLECAGSHGTS